jgi:hypothetical protein
MEIPVLIEPIPGVGFRATSGEPFAIVAQAATREDALDQIRGQVAAKLRNGASVATVEIQNAHPWAKAFGIFDPSDPLVQEWLRIIEENRSRPEEVE